MEEMVHLATKIEQKLKRKDAKKSSSNYNSSSWKEKNKNEGGTSQTIHCCVSKDLF
ncbi:hypothetical protein SESBI_29252 [Sesbania bispinosa]|nr:hypothetical protein SESBI_29252 [Sesbania bispinosa]